LIGRDVEKKGYPQADRLGLLAGLVGGSRSAAEADIGDKTEGTPTPTTFSPAELARNKICTLKSHLLNPAKTMPRLSKTPATDSTPNLELLASMNRFQRWGAFIGRGGRAPDDTVPVVPGMAEAGPFPPRMPEFNHFHASPLYNNPGSYQPTHPVTTFSYPYVEPAPNFTGPSDYWSDDEYVPKPSQLPTPYRPNNDPGLGSPVEQGAVSAGPLPTPPVMVPRNLSAPPSATLGAAEGSTLSNTELNKRGRGRKRGSQGSH
jgi:hypothetical protein